MKRAGSGIFVRSETWERFHTEHNGYIYVISEVKNFNANEGWKIMKREGGYEWVYALVRQKKGTWRYEGEKAYEIYEELLAQRRKCNNEIAYKGYDTFTKREENGNGVLCYSFSFKNKENGKPWEKDIEKTLLAVYYEEEFVSDYFTSFRECLEWSEKKIMEC